MKTQRTVPFFSLALVLTLLLTPVLTKFAHADAADWGSLKGRLVFAGDLGKPDAINVNKDVEYCGKHDLVDETIVIGENKGLMHVFVYLYVKKGKSVDIHPELEKPGDTVVLDNKGCRFEPHTLLVRTGQTLEIRNSDSGIGHNTNAQTLLRNPKFNDQVSGNTPLVKLFDLIRPSLLVTSIHG